MINRKHSLSLFVTFAVMLVVCSACSPSNGPHAKYIPKEALAVAAINGQQIYLKSNFRSIKKSWGFKKWKAGLVMQGSYLNDFVLTQLDNPLQSGIDFRKKIFIYTYTNRGGVLNANTGLVAAISNQSKFEEMLMHQNKKLTIEMAKGGYRYVQVNKHEVIGWNHEVMVYVKLSTTKKTKQHKRVNPRNDLHHFFTLTKENSLLNNQNFRHFLNKKNDVSLWYSLPTAKKVMTTALKFYRYSNNDQQILDEIFNFKDSYLHYDLNFEKGKVVFDSQYHLNKRLQKFYKETYGQQLSPAFLAQLSNKPLLGFMGFAWNFKGLYDWLQRVEGFEQSFEKVAAEAKLSPQEFLNTLQGEFAVAVTGFEKFTIREKGSPYGEYLTTILEKHEVDKKKLAEFRERLSKIPDKIRTTYAPAITAILSFKNDKIPSQALGLLAKYVKMKPVKGQTYHQFNWMKQAMFIGSYKNQLFLSNQQQNLLQALKQPHNDQQIPKNIRNALSHSSYAYLNLDFEKYPKNSQKHIKKRLRRDFEKVQSGLSLFEELKAQSKGFKGHLELSLSNKQSNSLEVVLNTLFNGVEVITLAND